MLIGKYYKEDDGTVAEVHNNSIEETRVYHYIVYKNKDGIFHKEVFTNSTSRQVEEAAEDYALGKREVKNV